MYCNFLCCSELSYLEDDENDDDSLFDVTFDEELLNGSSDEEDNDSVFDVTFDEDLINGTSDNDEDDDDSVFDVTFDEELLNQSSDSESTLNVTFDDKQLIANESDSDIDDDSLFTVTYDEELLQEAADDDNAEKASKPITVLVEEIESNMAKNRNTSLQNCHIDINNNSIMIANDLSVNQQSAISVEAVQVKTAGKWTSFKRCCKFLLCGMFKSNKVMDINASDGEMIPRV